MAFSTVVSVIAIYEVLIVRADDRLDASLRQEVEELSEGAVRLDPGTLYRWLGRLLDEGLLHLGLQAAAWRVPFLPTRVGLGSDLLRDNPRLTTFTSPVPGPGGRQPEQLVAMPAIELDAALCHLNVADRRGNAMYLGPDLYWDDLMLQAAPTGGRFISAEKVVDTEDLAGHGALQQMRISRMMVDGVVEAPGGAHFTLCDPEYPRDEAVQKAYAASATSPEAWAEFRAAWIDIAEDEYRRKVKDGAA